MTVKATYEGGILRPRQPLDLAEGQEIELDIPPVAERPGPDPDYIEWLLAELAALNVPTGQPETASIDHDKILYGGDSARTERPQTLQELERTAPDPRRAAEIMAVIAAMPLESGGESFSGEDHDRILYGEKGAR